jgi:hypothetical protein
MASRSRSRSKKSASKKLGAKRPSARKGAVGRAASGVARSVVAPSVVACWEDDPGDPKTQPARMPIEVPAPSQSATPLAFKLRGVAPAPEVYPVATPGFLYYAVASALRRTASFWGDMLPSGTRWQVGAVLAVNVDAGVDLNAFYTRGGMETAGLYFFHQAVRGRVFNSGESPDIASHEMGHALLDAIQPDLYDTQTIEAAALHESFGDMCAMLSALQVASFRDQVLNETGGTLNHSSRLSRLAEQLGAAIRMLRPDVTDPDCLRNASNSFFYRDPQTLPPNAPASQLSSQAHSFSRVFTGGFLDALAGMFKLAGAATSAQLQRVAEDMARIVVAGIAGAPVVPDYFSQVAASMIQAGEAAPFKGKYRDALKSAFVRRGLLSLQAAASLGALPRAARGRVAPSAARSAAARRALPMLAIPAAHYGLTQPILLVQSAAGRKSLSVTGSSLQLGPVEPRSAQSAAQAYTEDLFQRGHVEVGKHARVHDGLVNPFSFKTHRVTERDGSLVLERISFNCGFHG